MGKNPGRTITRLRREDWDAAARHAAEQERAITAHTRAIGRLAALAIALAVLTLVNTIVMFLHIVGVIG